MGTINNKYMDLLPNPLPDIYRADGVNSAVSNYIDTLSLTLKEQPDDNAVRLMINACNEYLFLTCSKRIKARHKEYFNLIHNHTIKHHEKNAFIKTVARTKSCVSFFYKCAIKLHNNKSLDGIRDIYACRTIIDAKDGKDTLPLIEQCYKVMDENIDYLISLGFTPCDAEPVKDTENFNPDENPEIIVPKSSLLSKKNRPFVKDYIATPKDNTYQSLHVILRDTHGNYFEYQVRTYSMDINAECGKASHKEFKKEQKKKQDIPKLSIEREKINLSGYRFFNNKVYDDSGIEISVPVIHETYCN